MIHPETHAITPDNGPRPAGKPQECFYCRGTVGEEHAEDCPCRSRTVVMRYSFDVVVDAMEVMTKEQLEFHRNDSSWCADNALSEIDRMREGGEDEDCWCGHFRAEYVREATIEDEARRKIEND